MRKKAVFFGGAAVVLLNLVVPPFQSPDEPHHFAAIMMMARGEENREAVEAETTALMDRNDWWRLIGLGRPVERPARISDIPFMMDRWGGDDFMLRLDGFTLFHRLMGFVMRPFGGWSLAGAYIVCRLAVVLLFAAGLGLAWRAAGVLGGKIAAYRAMVFLAVLLVPQFLMMGAAVSADAFVFFLGAAFFWGAAAFIAQKGRFYHGAAVLFPAGMGFLADRSAFVLGVLFVVLPVFVMRRRNYQNVIVWTLLFSIFFILLVYFTALKFPLQVERSVLRLKQAIDGAKAAGLGGMFSLDGGRVGFWAFLGDSFYLRFGWLVFAAPEWVYWVWRAFVGAAAAGLVLGGLGSAWRALMRRWKEASREAEVEGAEEGAVGGEGKGAGEGKTGRPGVGAAGAARAGGNGEFNPTGRWVLFSVLALFVQAAGIWVYYGANDIQAQGRYFFPLILPAATLLVLGISGFGEAVGKRLLGGRVGGRQAVTAVVIILAGLLGFVVWNNIVPTFHLVRQGPYVGI